MVLRVHSLRHQFSSVFPWSSLFIQFYTQRLLELLYRLLKIVRADSPMWLGLGLRSALARTMVLLVYFSVSNKQ
jgi:hypothetical protein